MQYVLCKFLGDCASERILKMTNIWGRHGQKFCVVCFSYSFFVSFYAPQLYRQVLLRAHISYGNSVCLPVRRSRPGTDSRPGEIETGFSPYGSPGSLVSDEVIWCQWVRRFHLNEGIKEGVPPLWNRYFSTIGSSSVKTVADRRRLLHIIASTADELSSGTIIDDLERPWTPKIGGFSEFLAILGCNAQFKTELRRNRSR